MSEKGKDEDGFKRNTGGLQGYNGSGRARGGKRGTRMNVEAAEELENGEKRRERKDGGRRGKKVRKRQ